MIIVAKLTLKTQFYSTPSGQVVVPVQTYPARHPVTHAIPHDMSGIP